MNPEIRRTHTQTVTLNSEDRTVLSLLRSAQRLFQLVPETASVRVTENLKFEGLSPKGIFTLSAWWDVEESA